MEVMRKKWGGRSSGGRNKRVKVGNDQGTRGNLQGKGFKKGGSENKKGITNEHLRRTKQNRDRV